MGPSWRRNSFVYIIILLAAAALATIFFSSPAKPAEVSLSRVIELSQQHSIQKIVVEGDYLNVTTKSGDELKTYRGDNKVSDIKDLGLNLDGVEVTLKPAGINWGDMAVGFLPLLLFGGLLFFIFFRARGANSQALNFGRSRARLFPPSKPTVTFDDVAGVDEAKQELYEIVEFLKSRERFQVLGARIPRGVLLVGPPGTGKTLLARAVAGEAGVPFFSISGSEFVEMFVGVGASRVRDLFTQAKQRKPSIIFIDEIDAVGRRRGAGPGSGHDEREQTLNQILTEMDGFEHNEGVIVLAATNRPDILDPALLRPGRFDRRVVLDRPDIAGRVAILKVHAKGKPLHEAVNLEVLAKQTVGFSGADLSNLMNEAAILAARRGKKIIEMSELEESIDRVIAGPERKSRRISAKEKEITAYHEAGHALVAKMLPNADPPHKISIIPRGMAAGYTKMLSEERNMWTPSQFGDEIATLLGGHAAEKLVFSEVTTGASQDIKQATSIARAMVTVYGMSDKLGPRTYGDKQELIFLGREISEQRDYGDKVANIIDEEVNQIIHESYEKAQQVLEKNRDKLTRLTRALITEETLDGARLETLFNEPVKGATVPNVTDNADTADTDSAGSKRKTPAPKPKPGLAPDLKHLPETT